ncbi:MAG TPA: ribosome rescue GTPase HflX [Burkholderiales bacterium]
MLVHVRFGGRSDAGELEELHLLAESAGAEVCGIVTGSRDRPDAATFVGKGKAQEIREAVAAERADLVVVNHELSPAQERNLERTVACRVVDRTGLILDIFAQRARSHEGKLQVELAQLEHLSSRLVRGWTHLERQRGGIGLRGPGETQLEVDRRLIRDRIKKLNERLQQVSQQRRSRRRARHKVPIPTVSMVGYTNAGKSSLFNRLTNAGVYAADQLFATLDPTMRRLELPGNAAVILADTVGFISKLPHSLVEAFKSTLEEVAQADLLLHVVDSHNPDSREHIEQVNRVLEEIGAQDVPQILVYNKIDLTGQAPRSERDAGGRVARVWLSATTGAGVDLLIDALAEHYRRRRRTLVLELPPSAGRLRALIYERFDVAREAHLASGSSLLELMLDGAQLAWLNEQRDFRPEYIVSDAHLILARAGSLS